MDLGIVGLTAEVPLVVNFDQNVHYPANLVPRDYKSFIVTPSPRANLFPGSGISPWVSAGGGFGYFKENSTLEFGGTNPGETGTTTGIFQMGVGLDVRLLSRLSLRGEARDFYSGVPQLNVDIGKSRQHNIFVGGGVVFHSRKQQRSDFSSLCSFFGSFFVMPVETKTLERKEKPQRTQRDSTANE
jgi:hypothetical protein